MMPGGKKIDPFTWLQVISGNKEKDFDPVTGELIEVAEEDAAAGAPGSPGFAERGMLTELKTEMREMKKEMGEVKAAGLLDPDGVVLGRYDREYLRHDGPEHVLCFAPTRSGKGVGLVVPTLLTWPGSAIVHDIKGENWQLTAGFRARHGRVLLFDPTNPNSSAYNPLLEVRCGEWEVRDVQNIADILVDPEGSLERRNHWELSLIHI